MIIKLVQTVQEVRDNGKGYKTTETREKVIEQREYDNYINSISFFRNLGGKERTKKNYTKAGYRVTELISISPDQQQKITRQFLFL